MSKVLPILLALAFAGASASAVLAANAPANTPAAGANASTHSSKPVKPATGDGGLGMALLGARVNADASIANGAGATGGILIGTGIFEVDFDRDVSNCFYTASSFTNDIMVDLEPRSGNVNGVFLEEVDNSGSNISEPFYLTVFCNR